MKPALGIVESLPPRIGDVAAMLRKLADAIDEGQHDRLTAAYVVLDYDDCRFDLRMFGRMQGPYDAIGAFQCAIAMIAKSRLDEVPE